MDTSFEAKIKRYLLEKYKEDAEQLFSQSHILQYLAYKTKSANRGAKARGSFANLYAIYVIVEDYLSHGFDKKSGYSKYEGAQFSVLFKRQRELPFGAKLQNHALNSRMNEEFFKVFRTQSGIPPIMRNLETQRYWFNENYLVITVGNKKINIAKDIIHIVDEYVAVKQNNFKQFIEQCETLQNIENDDAVKVTKFIESLLAPNVDARLFEIVSYSILKFYYKNIHKHIIWGFVGEDMTEDLDFKKYFLDIEKIERYPLSFVIKSEESIEDLNRKLRRDAIKTYIVEQVVDDYLACIEEIINIPTLKEYLIILDKRNMTQDILKEIILQSKVEYNYEDEE